MRALQQATEQLLLQLLSPLEWARAWEAADSFCGEQALTLLPAADLTATRQCLDALAQFASKADLIALDRGRGLLSQQLQQWDHWWWVASRTGEPWPAFSLPESAFEVTRQSGWSRITWSCPACGWQVAWQLQVEAWEWVQWPGPMTCPLCSIGSREDIGNSTPS